MQLEENNVPDPEFDVSHDEAPVVKDVHIGEEAADEDSLEAEVEEEQIDEEPVEEEEPVIVEEKQPKSNSGKPSLWSQTIEQLPTVITTSKGPVVRLLQAALNYQGESYLPLEGKMNSTLKGMARRIKNEAGCEHSDRYADAEVWHHLLGKNPPSVSFDKTEFNRGTLLLQSLLYIHGYQIHPSGYWNDQTQMCFDQYCKKNDLNNKLTATVWASLLDVK